MVKGILDFLEVDYKSPLNVSTWCTKMSKDDELPAAYKKVMAIGHGNFPAKYLNC